MSVRILRGMMAPCLFCIMTVNLFTDIESLDRYYISAVFWLVPMLAVIPLSLSETDIPGKIPYALCITGLTAIGLLNSWFFLGRTGNNLQYDPNLDFFFVSKIKKIIKN